VRISASIALTAAAVTVVAAVLGTPPDADSHVEGKIPGHFWAVQRLPHAGIFFRQA
jgi:hypothetical protein